jgi:predicted HicB family RNase H-like nuclease
MAAVLKDVQTPKAERKRGKARVEAMDGTVEVQLQPEVLRRAMAAAKASGQTTTEWICGAVVEAVERRSKGLRNRVVTKQ